MVTFENNNQLFMITGINDTLALEDALAHIAAGRPFGRKNMRRIEHFYGVEVIFAGKLHIDTWQEHDWDFDGYNRP